MLSGDQRTMCKKWVSGICLVIFTCVGFVCVGYGGYLLHERNHVSCPIPSAFSEHDFPNNPIHIYSSFCNPSAYSASQPHASTNLNVSYWCDQLGCGGHGPDDYCLLYATGSNKSVCPATDGGCALSCFPSLEAHLIAGIVLVAIGSVILIIESLVIFCRWKSIGEWC